MSTWLALDRALTRRALLPPELPEPEGAARMAAVSVILIERPRGVELLLIRRSERESDPWSGHMALPGGHRETGDRTLLQTAIRETWEEVGLALDRDAELLGALEDVAPVAPRPVLVRPFVFALPGDPKPSLSPEVDSVVFCSLEELRKDTNGTEFELVREGKHYRFPAYQVGPRVVWGLTYKVLSSLLVRVARAALPPDLETGSRAAP